MKSQRFFFLVIFFFLLKFSIAQDTAIHFNRMPYAEIFKRAKETHRPVLLYFHINGCGACIQLERGGFTLQDVYGYINGNYISYNINASKGEGIEINKTYGVRTYPTMLLLNEKGTVMDKIEGYTGIYTVFERLKKTVEEVDLYTKFKKEYAEGKRDPEFLYLYTRQLARAGDLDTNTVILEYLASVKKPKLLEPKNIAYIYDYTIFNHKVMIPPDHIAFVTMYENRETFAKYFRLKQIEARLIFALYTTVIKTCNAENFEYLYRMIKVFQGRKAIGYEETDGSTTDNINEVDTLSLRSWYDLKCGNLSLPK